MSSFFTSEGRSRCKFCRAELPTYAASGRCGVCKHWFTLDRATIEPGPMRARALARSAALARHAGEVVMSRSELFLPIACVIFAIQMNASGFVLFGRMAWRAFLHALGW